MKIQSEQIEFRAPDHRNYVRLNINPGDKYGQLTVVGEAPARVQKSGLRYRVMICRCECGGMTHVRVANLVRFKVTSCGCKIPQHGYSSHKLYGSWRGMMHRTTSKKCIDAHRYIERGITVCDEWRKFIPFKEWALQNGYREGLQIDRIDNDKGYYPDNCRFVTATENVRNRSTTVTVQYRGNKVALASVLADYGMMDRYLLVLARIKRGWDHHKAIHTPARKGNYRRKHVQTS